MPVEGGGGKANAATPGPAQADPPGSCLRRAAVTPGFALPARVGQRRRASLDLPPLQGGARVGQGAAYSRSRGRQ